MAYEAFATKNDLATYLFTQVDKLPEDVDRMLMRASELIAQVIIPEAEEGVILDTLYDPNLKANIAEAKKLATCAQVEYWIDFPESFAISGMPQNVDSGDVKMSLGDLSKKGPLSPRARAFLNKMGLLYRGVNPRRYQSSGGYI